MIHQRAAIREFTQTAAGVFVALFAILMTTQLIRLLGDAAGGRLASEAVVALLGFRAISYLPVVAWHGPRAVWSERWPVSRTW